MNRLVAHLTGGMQNLCQILCQQALVIEDFKILPGCVVGGEEESVIDKHQVDGDFSDHPSFIRQEFGSLQQYSSASYPRLNNTGNSFLENKSCYSYYLSIPPKTGFQYKHQILYIPLHLIGRRYFELKSLALKNPITLLISKFNLSYFSKSRKSYPSTFRGFIYHNEKHKIRLACFVTLQYKGHLIHKITRCPFVDYLPLSKVF